MKEKQNQQILLITSNFEFSELEKICYEINPKIITFDYKSHKFLDEKDIVHETSDSFLNNDEVSQIQELSHKYTKWYEDEELSNILKYENINVGKLYYMEFFYFLLPYLKKILEIKNIKSKFSNSKFFVTYDLYDISKKINENTEYVGGKKSEGFLYDTLAIKITNSVEIKISSKQYQKIKKISEKFFKKLTNKNKINSKTKILLVEFDPIKYKEFLIKSKDRSLNLVLFNRNRPAIWNTESLKILRKSNCVIPNIKIQKKEIPDVNQITENKVKQLLEHEDILTKFFMYEKFSFWKILQPIFLRLLKERMVIAIKEIILTKKLFSDFNFSGITIWSESGFHEQISIEIAKRKKIPILLLQHGLWVDELQALEYNKFTGDYPILADKFVVWGNVLEDYAISSGIAKEKIENVGSLEYDNLFMKKHSKEENFVLLALTAPRKVNVSGFLNKTVEDYEKNVVNICKNILKHNKKLIVKLHPFKEEHNISQLIKKIDPKIKVIHSGKIFPLLQSCEILVSMGITTAILEAQIIQKPVISIYADYDFGNPYILRAKSCLVTEPKNFEKQFEKIINDKELKNKIIESGKISVSQNFSNHNMAIQKFLDLLEKI